MLLWVLDIMAMSLPYFKNEFLTQTEFIYLLMQSHSIIY